MIQKMQESAKELAGDLDPAVGVPFPVLNDSEEILLLTDEAHRSHTSTLHARLMAALPNAAKIGFTGTPIPEQDKKQTHQIFGPFIDAHRLDQLQENGASEIQPQWGDTAKKRRDSGAGMTGGGGTTMKRVGYGAGYRCVTERLLMLNGKAILGELGVVSAGSGSGTRRQSRRDRIMHPIRPLIESLPDDLARLHRRAARARELLARVK